MTECLSVTAVVPTLKFLGSLSFLIFFIVYHSAVIFLVRKIYQSWKFIKHLNAQNRGIPCPSLNRSWCESLVLIHITFLFSLVAYLGQLTQIPGSVNTEITNGILFLFIAVFRISFWGILLYLVYLQYQTFFTIAVNIFLAIWSQILELVWHLLLLIYFLPPWVSDSDSWMSQTERNNLISAMYFFYNTFILVTSILLIGFVRIFEMRHRPTPAFLPLLKYLLAIFQFLIVFSSGVALLFVVVPFSLYSSPFNQLSCTGMLLPLPLLIYDCFRISMLFILELGILFQMKEQFTSFATVRTTSSSSQPVHAHIHSPPIPPPLERVHLRHSLSRQEVPQDLKLPDADTQIIHIGADNADTQIIYDHTDEEDSEVISNVL